METLYYRPTCPYCQKVIAFVKQNNIELAYKDISADDTFRDELINGGGKKMVPCLYTKASQFMYESDDIITYLKG